MKNELKQTILRAKGDKLKNEFYEFFLSGFGFNQKTIKIEGSHENIFYAQEYFRIGNLSDVKEFSICGGNSKQVKDIEEIKQLKYLKIYYENLTRQEFSEIIKSVRNFYLQCGVYIDCLVIDSIIDLYYDESGKYKSI